MGGGSDQGQGGTSPWTAHLGDQQSLFGPRLPLLAPVSGFDYQSYFLQASGGTAQIDCDPVEVERTKKGLAGDAETLRPYVDLPGVATQAFGHSPLAQELDALASQAHGHMRGALATLTSALQGYADAAHAAHQVVQDADADSEQHFRTTVNRLTATTGTAFATTDDASQKAIDAARKAQQAAAQDPSACAPTGDPTAGDE